MAGLCLGTSLGRNNHHHQITNDLNTGEIVSKAGSETRDVKPTEEFFLILMKGINTKKNNNFKYIC